MPEVTDLSSLRLFLKQTYPYLPTKFLFETPNGVVIDHVAEKNLSVMELGPILYLHSVTKKGKF